VSSHPPVDLIHIHEDDWGMRNLYPVAAWAEADADLTESIEASQRNRAPGGMGWTDMHVIQPPKMTFRDVGLDLAQVITALEALMPRVGRFNATIGAAIGSNKRDPFGSYQDDPVCFGFDAACFIKIDVAENGIHAIWFERREKDKAKLDALRAGIEAIDRLAPSLIADYWFDALGSVSDKAFMDAYFGTDA
jgi:hypothetical protein